MMFSEEDDYSNVSSPESLESYNASYRLALQRYDVSGIEMYITSHLLLPHLRSLCTCFHLHKTGKKSEVANRIAIYLNRVYEEDSIKKDFTEFNKLVSQINRLLESPFSIKPVSLFDEELIDNCFLSRNIEIKKIPFPFIVEKAVSPTLHMSKCLELRTGSQSTFKIPIALPEPKHLVPLNRFFVLCIAKCENIEEWEAGTADLRFRLARGGRFVFRYGLQYIDRSDRLRRGLIDLSRYFYSPYLSDSILVTIPKAMEVVKRYLVQVIEVTRDQKSWIERSLPTENHLPRISSSDLVSVDRMIVSLRCPLGLNRLVQPVRSRKCPHLQCFELKSWVSLNHRHIETGKCPVCSRSMSTKDLFIDSFTLQILKNESVEEIEINLADYSWTPTSTKASSQTVDLLEVSDSYGPEPPVFFKRDPLDAPITHPQPAKIQTSQVPQVPPPVIQAPPQPQFICSSPDAIIIDYVVERQQRPPGSSAFNAICLD